jgi:predicted dehydrogenase
MSPQRVDRRNFLTTSAVSAGLAIPAIVSSRVFGKDAPSETLRIGCIGTGRMGHGDMRECLMQGLNPAANARIVAVCDIDRRRAEHARAEVERLYTEQLPAAPHPDITIFNDFRELLARDDIDGVTISTPDHWHGLIAIAAARAGKGIYLQKPLTYTIAEGRKLVDAVREHRVVLQTGSQQRSDGRFRQACELVRNGRLGKLHTIRVTLPKDQGIGRAAPMEVPSNLNYDMWLGPTPPTEYTVDRVHPQSDFSRPGWLQIESYCRGMITGWGAHMFDTAQWGNGSDDTGPVEMEATGEFPDRGLFDVHTTFQATGRYANGVRLLAESGDPAGVRFEGDSGWLDVGRGHLKADRPEILTEPMGTGHVRLYESNNHMLNFLQCVRNHQEPISPVEAGHRSNTICVITHLAMKLGRRLQWDPRAEQFVGDPEANSLLDYEHRRPWTL